jgi:eukaryotic-like serine/threonine-protein kinase
MAFGDGSVAVLAGYHSVFWFALLAMYGLFVPNTWRRCAVVVGLIAVCPLAVVLVEESQSGWPLAGRPLLYYLAVVGFWAVFGSVLAVLGSRHIEVLRQQANEARRLGQYRLTKRIGEGGMGEVYLAEHVLLRRPCAVQVIRTEQAGDPKHMLRFEREVQVTAGLTLAVAVLARAFTTDRKIEVTLSRRLRTNPLPGKHAAVADRWRNIG